MSLCTVAYLQQRMVPDPRRRLVVELRGSRAAAVAALHRYLRVDTGSRHVFVNTSLEQEEVGIDGLRWRKEGRVAPRHDSRLALEYVAH